MAYAQWIQIANEPANYSATIKNVKLPWGKFYKCPNQDNEIPVSDIEGHVVQAGTEYDICSCGRENSPSGTEGSFDYYDGNVYVGTFNWDCPYTGSNSWSWQPGNSGYLTQTQGGSTSGAIGLVVIKSVKM